MKKSRKAQIERLQSELYALKWEKADIHASKIDPDMKAIYVNDVDYRAYRIQQKIEDIEHEEGMFPLKLMFVCFVIFALVLVLYRISH